MDYKLDWLTLTLKPSKDNVKYKCLTSDDELCPLEKWCFDFLNIADYKGSFRKKTGSIQHYNLMYSYNGLSIALSAPSRFSEQGLMFRFSGDAIAWYEKLMRERIRKAWSWVDFLKDFFSLGAYGLNCKCTRIDLAFDDIAYDIKDKLIDLKIVKKALERGEFVSAFRSTDSKEPCKLLAYDDVKRNTKGDILGETYYLGNRKSKVFLRFYDKLLECRSKKEPVDDKIVHWVRMEFEFKDVRAMTVCDSLIMLSADEFGKYISKVTNHYVRFIVPKGTRHNYSRCNSRKWWNQVVGTIEKAKLVENKAYRNRYRNSIRWLKTYVFPTIFAILHCHTVDEFIKDVYDTCTDKIADKGIGSTYDNIIHDYFVNKDSEILKGYEIHKATAEDYQELICELDACAYGARMKQLGKDLCEALDLMHEYKRVHRDVDISGMYNKHIRDFRVEIEDYPFPYYA